MASASSIVADRTSRERADPRAALDHFYLVAEPSSRHYRDRLDALTTAGSRVLELGCGLGSTALDLAEAGRQVVGIDISPVAIERSARAAAAQGVTGASFEEMDAEHLRLGDRRFDLVCGSGILHHLDLATAYGQIASVLRPDGAAVFHEPLAYNPAINAFRHRTSRMRSVDEHPLRRQDLDLARRWFGEVKARQFHLADLAGGVMGERRGAATVTRLGRGVDRGLLKVPGMRWLAWVVVVELGRPHFAG